MYYCSAHASIYIVSSHELILSAVPRNTWSRQAASFTTDAHTPPCRWALVLLRRRPALRARVPAASRDSGGELGEKAEVQPSYVNSSFRFPDLCGKK